MDRPEDIETNPVTGRVYVVLTNNERAQAPSRSNAANPRAEQHARPHRRDHPAAARTAPTMRPPRGPGRSSSLRGEPGKPTQGARYRPRDLGERLAHLPGQRRLRQQGPAVDRHRQGGEQRRRHRRRALRPATWRRRAGADAAVLRRAQGRRDLRPAASRRTTARCSRRSSIPARARLDLRDPSTRWPDFKDGAPPRPSVIAITKKDGGPIGS